MLTNLAPIPVFQFFGARCDIPRPSGNTIKMQEYLVNFAQTRGLEYIYEECGNVIIYKDATLGFSDKPPLILQGHMDMVAVTVPKSLKDLNHEPIELLSDGDYVYAKDSSLGADDGIALAYMLAVLDGYAKNHPALICVFTVDEETGMHGARQLDASVLKSARRLINIDSEEEGILTCGCAGGLRAKIGLKLSRQNEAGIAARLRVSGLIGGHSGIGIHKGRANANVLLGRILHELLEDGLIKTFGGLSGGTKDNAICQSADAVILCEDNEDNIEALSAKLEEIRKRLFTQYSGREKDMSIRVRREKVSDMWLSRDDALKLTALISALPDGVQAMSQDVPGLAETSLNIGIFNLPSQSEYASLCISLRSSVLETKRALADKISIIAKAFGADITFDSDYPSWHYAKHSPLRESVCDVYEQLYGKKMEVIIVHAGLECGYFMQKVPELDCVSLGPEILNVHTTDEKLSVPSVKRTWEFLCKLLEN